MGDVRKHYPASVKKEAVKAVKSGMSTKDVSEAMDISVGSIRRWARAANIPKKHPTKGHHFSDAERRAALDLLVAGKSPTEVANAIGCCPWTVIKWRRGTPQPQAPIAEAMPPAELKQPEGPSPGEIASALLERVVFVLNNAEDREVLIKSYALRVKELEGEVASKIAEMNRVIKIHNEQAKAKSFTTSEELIRLARKQDTHGGNGG